MNRLLLAALFTFAACGVSDPPFLEAHASQLTTASGGNAPIDCVATCQAVREQLIRDFSVLPSSIDCPRDFAGANTCGACNERFVRLYGVSMAQCP